VAALDEKRLCVIGLTQPPGAVQEAALGWPEHEEAPLTPGLLRVQPGGLQGSRSYGTLNSTQSG
jgi:hypothetical protein